MSQVFVAERTVKPKGDPLLAAVSVLLVGMGLVVLFSASYYRAMVRFDDPFHFITNQIIFSISGLLAALLGSRLRLELVRRLIPWLIIATLALMGLTMIAGIGMNLQGGQRWIGLANMSFQPSELVKLALILYLASILAKREQELGNSLRGLLPPLGVLVLFMALIYLQNNFSTTVFIMAVAVAMFFVAGVKARFFILLGLICVPLVVIGVSSQAYRMDRISVFMAPDSDPADKGYQTLSAQAAIRSGQFLGKGMGQGTRKLGQLPEAQSDFIFAVVAEELGFLGVLGTMGLFAFLGWRGYRCAQRAKDGFDRLLAFGLTTAIVLQALLNIAVTIGVVPPTGINLPFFSSGGSSLVVSMVMLGLLYNVSRRTEQAAEAAHG